MPVLDSPVSNARNKRPVFVVGCHRSGTNLLYDTLLSAGGFAIYRGYLPIHKMLVPRFGSLGNLENRRCIIRVWLRSKGFRRSGLDAEALTSKLLAEGKTGGDFIRIVMNEIARQQNAVRWAVYDPDNVLYMRRIKTEIPNALFIHIIRDGRDIALSLKKMGEFRPVPWNREPASLETTALYWQWMVKKGKEHGKLIPNDYAEIHYEELVRDPRHAMGMLSTFLDQDLDWDRVQAVSLGRVRESNSSFRGDTQKNQANPVNRWRENLSSAQVADLEILVGDCLEESGYDLATPPEQRKPRLRHRFLRWFYPSFLDFKGWLKIKTPAGRLTDLSALELSDSITDESEQLTPTS